MTQYPPDHALSPKEPLGFLIFSDPFSVPFPFAPIKTIIITFGYLILNQEFIGYSERSFCANKTDATIGHCAELQRSYISTITWFKSKKSFSNLLIPEVTSGLSWFLHNGICFGIYLRLFILWSWLFILTTSTEPYWVHKGHHSSSGHSSVITVFG